MGGEAEWWRNLEFEDLQADRWEIGPLDLWLRREEREWRLAHRWAEDDRQGWRHERGVSFPDDSPPGLVQERFAVNRTQGAARLEALTADQPVVARPRTALRVPPGQVAKIYVSSPLSIAVSVDDGIRLRELPTRRQSKTWFGPSTREGELAYALKTTARTDLAGLEIQRHRLLTPVLVDNRAAEMLEIERLNLPVPRLSIFDQDGSLWSEEVRLVRADVGDTAELEIAPGPPPETTDATRVSGPRIDSDRGHLFRAFSSVLRLAEVGE